MTKKEEIDAMPNLIIFVKECEGYLYMYQEIPDLMSWLQRLFCILCGSVCLTEQWDSKEHFQLKCLICDVSVKCRMRYLLSNQVRNKKCEVQREKTNLNQT